MKKIKRILIIIVIIITISLGYLLTRKTYSADKIISLENNINQINSVLETKKDITNPYALKAIVDGNGDVPSTQYYAQLSARSIHELKAYDDKIFLGLGDWSNDSGRLRILYYDTKKEKIIYANTIEDEAIETFNIIDGKLYTTGTDPLSAWDTGSYYIYNGENNKWDQFEKDTDWIHVFEIEKYHDKFFMCGSVNNADFTPIQVSYDNGETFENVKIYDKNGKELEFNNNLRFYSFDRYNDNLYAYTYATKKVKNENGQEKTVALESNGIYKYDEEKNEFNFVRSFIYDRNGKEVEGVMVYPGLMESIRYNFLHFRSNVEFNDYFIYVSGNYLYKFSDTDNFENYQILDIDSYRYIQDVVVNGDTMYMLAYHYNEDKSFSTRIYSTKDLENFDLVYEFNIDSFPFSMEYHNNSLYVGTIYHTDSKDYVDYSNELKEKSEAGSLYKIDLNNLDKKLTLDKDNNIINITKDGLTYPVTYNLDSDNYIFKTTLTFNKKMSEKQWNQEYTKLKNLNLIYTLVDNSQKIDYDYSISYYDKIINDSIKLSSNEYTNGIDFTKSIFDNNINIENRRFNLTSENIKSSEEEYIVEVTFKIYDIEDSVTSDSYFVNNQEGYIYVGKETFQINKINIKQDNYEINEDKLLIQYENDRIDEYQILSIDFHDLKVSNNNITIENKVSYDDFISNITMSENLSFKIYNQFNEEINSNEISDNMKLKIYYNDKIIDEYVILNVYLKFDETLVYSDNVISNIEVGTTIIDVINKIETNGEIIVLDKNSNLIEDQNQTLKTGYIFKIVLNNIEKIYKISVSGDIDGDGFIGKQDITLLSKYLIHEFELEEEYIKASDYDNNNVININDVIKITRNISK